MKTLRTVIASRFLSFTVGCYPLVWDEVCCKYANEALRKGAFR